MIKDLPNNDVHNIFVSAVLESSTPEDNFWHIYIINKNNSAIDNVLVASRGYGNIGGKEIKTTTLRHFIPSIDAKKYALIEPIDSSVLGLNNEYWISFTLDGVMYDKKFIFLPESILDENMIQIPLIGKLGVLIGA